MIFIYGKAALLWESVLLLKAPMIFLFMQLKYCVISIIFQCSIASLNNHCWLKLVFHFLLVYCSMERRKYYKHIFKAKRYPKKYISIILDGMDQQTTCLPKPLYNSKFFSSMWKLQCHVVGVIVHGRGHHIFADVGEIPSDSNATCNIIIQTLMKYHEKDDLPPVFYLQMDNCGRENKNKYVFGLCCLLVELGVFKKVRKSSWKWVVIYFFTQITIMSVTAEDRSLVVFWKCLLIKLIIKRHDCLRKCWYKLKMSNQQKVIDICLWSVINWSTFL